MDSSEHFSHCSFAGKWAVVRVLYYEQHIFQAFCGFYSLFSIILLEKKTKKYFFAVPQLTAVLRLPGAALSAEGSS